MGDGPGEHRRGYPDSPPCLLVRLQLAGRRRCARTCWPRSPPKAVGIGPLSPVRAKDAGQLVFDCPSAAARPGISRGLVGGHLALGAPLRTCHDLTSDPAGGGNRGCQGSVAEQVRRRLPREGFPALGHATPPFPLGPLVLLRGAGRFHWPSRTVRNHSAAGRCVFPQESACRRPRTQATCGRWVRSRPPPPPTGPGRGWLAPVAVPEECCSRRSKHRTFAGRRQFGLLASLHGGLGEQVGPGGWRALQLSGNYSRRPRSGAPRF